ncbi:MAG: ABC transporter ATP-binding protein [Deltaproteobacteria bacterium]|nr:ABC transporter ATP-binding protein [Deltaproteobacteria bacterium]
MLIFQDFSAGYGNRFVLNNIDVRVDENLFIGVIGRNGSGKSTLIKSLAGLIYFVKGEIFYRGISLLKRKSLNVVSYIPQEINVVFGFSVYEILRMSQRSYQKFFSRISNSERKRLDDVIDKFELKGILDRNIFSLSGGEKKRVMIARGVAQNSDIILLDEPLSGLDIDHQIKVFQILKEISLSGRMVVASVHDLSMAAQFCDKIMLLDNGRLIRYGTVEDVLTYSNVKNTFGVEVYVGVNEINQKRFLIPFK